MIIFKTHQARDYIKEYLPENAIIVEAGAFQGQDTKKLTLSFPDAFIHAFEPVPELFELLKKNTQNLKNIQCYELALSDKNGTATFYFSEKKEKPGLATQAGSLRKPKERLTWSPIQFPKTIEVQTITLDTWAQENNIQRIDCLWLDMQGFELNVLQASKKILPTVTVIFTEVSFIESYENQPKHEDVKKWLEQHGFQEVGRDFKNKTDWFFGNSLFVRK